MIRFAMHFYRCTVSILEAGSSFQGDVWNSPLKANVLVPKIKSALIAVLFLFRVEVILRTDFKCIFQTSDRDLNLSGIISK